MIPSAISDDMWRRMVMDDLRAQKAWFRKFYLGYTETEESVWRRFNRCCHESRRIRLKPIPVTIRVGGPAVSVRRPVALSC